MRAEKVMLGHMGMEVVINYEFRVQLQMIVLLNHHISFLAIDKYNHNTEGNVNIHCYLSRAR